MKQEKYDTDSINSQTDIVELVSRYVELKKQGAEYVANCLFHSESTPSMTVSPQKGFVHCFGCGAHHDAVGFLMAAENIEFTEACKRLLNGSGTALPPVIPQPQTELKKSPPRITQPAPDDTLPDMTIRSIGAPEAVYTYRTQDGNPYGYVARYLDPKTGKKTIRCWSYGKRSEAEPAQWACGHFSSPRPLYGWESLSENKQILIVEGEKTADAAKRLFPQLTVIAWPGGAASLENADWSPLKTRKVVLLADYDEPGQKAMQRLAKLLHKIGVAEIKHIVVKTTISGDTPPDGWDLADAHPDTTPDEAMAWAKTNIIIDNQTLDSAAAQLADLPAYPHDENPPITAYYDDDMPQTGEQSQVWQKTQQRPSTPIVEPLTDGGKVTSASLGVISRRMSDVTIRAVDWLWKGKIPLGKVTGISGNPGLGKSQITASLAATVSLGGKWPVTRDQAPLGSVLLLNAEDDADDTLGPRLLAAGADLSRIHIIDAIRATDERGDAVNRGLDLVRDLDRVAITVNEIGDVKLIIIDPVSAYMGGADSHKMADVVGIMARLKTLASKTRCAVIMVNHLNKSAGQDALLKTQGSIGFVSHARAVWGVCKDKDDPNKRYFVPLKNNLGPDSEAAALSYSIEEFHLTDSEPLITTSRILWDAQPVTKSAQELMASAEGAEDTTTDCEAFLLDILQFGPVPVQDIETAARKAGHLHGTLRRAKARLKIQSTKQLGMAGKWQWQLPEPKSGRGSYQDKDD